MISCVGQIGSLKQVLKISLIRELVELAFSWEMDRATDLYPASKYQRVLHRHGHRRHRDWCWYISQESQTFSYQDWVSKDSIFLTKKRAYLTIELKIFSSFHSVCTIPGDRVPGPRSQDFIPPAEFPWMEAINVIERCRSDDAYRLSMELSRSGLVCGPSSGLALQGELLLYKLLCLGSRYKFCIGLYNYLQKQKDAGTLRDLVQDDGEVHCVFLCCDLPYQYLNDYFVKLGESYFHPIQNKVSLSLGHIYCAALYSTIIFSPLLIKIRRTSSIQIFSITTKRGRLPLRPPCQNYTGQSQKQPNPRRGGFS